MKTTLGKVRKLLREASYARPSRNGSHTFEFPVHEEDGTYIVTATYDPRMPYEVEIWQATDPQRNEVDVEELGRRVRLDQQEPR